MGDLYEEFLIKAEYFKTTAAKILSKMSGAGYVNTETFFKGFFLFFVYRDFALREILSYVAEFKNPKIAGVLFQIERDY